MISLAIARTETWVDDMYLVTLVPGAASVGSKSQ